MKTQNNNPICPYTKNECISFITDNLNCKMCSEYGNGVRATGATPFLGWILKKLKVIK